LDWLSKAGMHHSVPNLGKRGENPAMASFKEAPKWSTWQTSRTRRLNCYSAICWFQSADHYGGLSDRCKLISEALHFYLG
jgi:hypothetical protein